MAEIFLARLQGAGGFEKLVCIKRLLPALAKDTRLVDMFLNEARIAAQITHPNVCQVFELGEIEGRYFIAMEYLEGVPLACFRRRDLYPPTTEPRLIAGMAIQACEGLHHAHQLRRDDAPLDLVHRDISPNNLFATIDGVVKVLDFGLAKVQDSSVRTSTVSLKGTYAYMAPEQLRSERLDRRTDVFGLGAVLWELFARRYLFRRQTDYLTFQAITSEPIPSLRQLRPDIPPAIEAAITKALSRDRDRRHSSARAFGEALAAAIAPLGGSWGQAQIADEVTRTFATRLSEQRELVRVARTGAELDLEVEHSPSLATEDDALETTPIPSVTSATETLDGATTLDTPSMVTLRSRGRKLLPTIVVIVAIASVAVIATLIATNRGRRSATVDAAAIVTAADAVAVVDARVATSAADATGAPPPSVVDALVVDQGASEAPADANNARVVDPRPVGPPGFITIDSAPVYAVIFVDGVRKGETPLVSLKLAPGRHTVRAVAATGGTKTFVIVIESGKTAPTKQITW